jgi:hypothetical protein
MATTSITSTGVTFPDATTQTTNGVFASGTATVFAQTAAPTGWTKLLTNNDSALRVVTGAASTGGSVAFSTAFASQAVSGTPGGTTLATAQIPSHTHTFPTGAEWAGNNASYSNAFGRWGGWNPTSSATGGGGSHNHSFTGTAINLAVKYVDVIIATKN